MAETIAESARKASAGSWRKPRMKIYDYNQVSNFFYIFTYLLNIFAGMTVGICEMARIWIIVVKWNEWNIIIDIKVSSTKSIKICLSWHSLHSYYSLENSSLLHDWNIAISIFQVLK